MSDVAKAIQHICDEKGLEYDVVLEAIQTALGAAYRKDFGSRQGNYKVKFSVETGDIQVWDVKEVVDDVDEEQLEKDQEELTRRREAAQTEGRDLTDEEVEDLVRFNPKMQIMMSEVKAIKKDAVIGEILEIEQEVPGEFGRMAAQTAKQVVIQKLREAERNSVYDDFKHQEGQIVSGIVQRRDRSGSIIVDLGKITGIVGQDDQVKGERYRPGERMQFFVISVEMGSRGPQIMLSRTRKDMVRVVFEQEIPEIGSGEVVIKDISREPGQRSKVAVWTDDGSIDPIGSCIGQRGSRITTIIEELGGEKIDIIQYSDNAEEFIKHALSPAKIIRVELNEETKDAIAFVAEDQFSLAIGRNGQNVRLAAELTGWKIKVQQDGTDTVVSSEDEAENAEASVSTESSTEEESEKEEVTEEPKAKKEELKEEDTVIEPSTDEKTDTKDAS
ncbi:MAG: transcription termination/antitermination protein NusA [Candidatus Magasanikbacteria bacterium]|jgi:transcription termination/antitermination protein NusA|nr:transcription termination/antitermination protein NusA [Candidatus Magasanikbacteria bacterium]MBT4220761.1 transcription termination/antitermination protein NusA [Candidatus Magasanikbacteria bacterium]MBT4350106.1 transcription termination/antitermination protein NusA [Candidatus Magasanikbacteria bacterium]MBT4541451.1 transcription termination/antitermination protein NusA [Candidatus Magasanikbacteria bacterium]MBT6252979.1 transcription termination/antitermination protein NusA [Candidat